MCSTYIYIHTKRDRERERIFWFKKCYRERDMETCRGRGIAQRKEKV